ncbi:parvulin-like peptidyl-prolyl isomerase [Beggiatoa alba B18LD]|uniref:peptidylprolyl isomerase n=1 Tax=Beggiatoa alba B18LD TaxID=395493 RepID=I3CGU7_9GAMM|nr:peptidylprolyl isomerase [Beggiatoa alba]EIJ42840.1 parvulin-like peptidyl-prolyl isomerase [Beggiatoa alba B18LD]
MKAVVLAGCLFSLGYWNVVQAAETSAPATGTNKPLATINGQAITQQMLADYKAFRQKYAGEEESPTSDEALLEELVSRELLVADALKNGVDKSPEFLNQLEAMRKNLLVGLTLERYLATHPLEDATLKADYEEKIKLAQGNFPQEFNVSHILVDSQEVAKALINELNAGKPFDELAKANSKDTITGEKGGELGWITPQQVTASFAEAMGKIEKGFFSQQAVQSEFGWHIIKINDKRPISIPPFDSVKEKVRKAMQAEQKQAYIEELRIKNPVEILLAPNAGTEQTAPTQDATK